MIKPMLGYLNICCLPCLTRKKPTPSDVYDNAPLLRHETNSCPPMTNTTITEIAVVRRSKTEPRFLVVEYHLDDILLKHMISNVQAEIDKSDFTPIEDESTRVLVCETQFIKENNKIFILVRKDSWSETKKHLLMQSVGNDTIEQIIPYSI